MRLDHLLSKEHVPSLVCIQRGRMDSHFIGSYLVVTLMGGTFDIRVVLAQSLVRLVLRGWFGRGLLK